MQHVLKTFHRSVGDTVVVHLEAGYFISCFILVYYILFFSFPHFFFFFSVNMKVGTSDQLILINSKEEHNTSQSHPLARLR